MRKRIYAVNRKENPSPRPRSIPLYNRIVPETEACSAAEAGADPVEPKIADPLEVDGRLVSLNVVAGGHRTSVRLEAVHWHALNAICKRERIRVNDLITLISDKRHPNASLTATIRAFTLAYFWHRANKADEGLSASDRGVVDILKNATFQA